MTRHRCLAMSLLFVVAGSLAAQDGRVPVRAGTSSGRQLLAPAVREHFSMVLFGDRTTGYDRGLKVLADAVTMANRLAPDFVVTVGDHINGYNRTPDWLEQFKRFEKIMSGLAMPWYPVVGNHDVYGYRGAAGGNLESYRKYFGPLYYSFDFRFAHVICLFSDESLAFSDPAKNQNMSRAQMAWLRKDLAATSARIIFCFLHHPRWTRSYRGCNWPRVHEILRRDGRVKAVFAGHLHNYRDDGERDGIHYYTLAATGGKLGPLKASSALHHVTHVRVFEDRIAMAILPVGSVRGADMVLGTEFVEMMTLGGGAWLQVDGRVLVSTTGDRRSGFKLAVTNTSGRPVKVTGRITVGRGWRIDRAAFAADLRPGAREVFPVRVTAPAYAGRRPSVTTEVTLAYPLQSGLVQPITVKRAIPVELRDLAPGRVPAANRVLCLDGKSAVRVDLPVIDGPMTLECWARGLTPRGRVGLVARTQNANYGLFWTPWPQASFHVKHRGTRASGERGYLRVTAAKTWDWTQWNHLAMTYDGTLCRFWVNGVLQGSDQGTGPSTSPRYPLYVGADPDRRGRAESFFKGAIDEVRVSTTVRYRKAFRPAVRHRRDTQTLLLLHFDGGLEGVFPDDSGRGHHGWPVARPRRIVEEIRPRTTKSP